MSPREAGAMTDIPARVSTKGQLTIPKLVRDSLGIVGGDQVVFRVAEPRAMLARDTEHLGTPDPIQQPTAVWRRVPWDAGRRTRLQIRSKPRRPMTPPPETEVTVDLRPEPDDLVVEADGAAIELLTPPSFGTDT